MGKAKHFCNSSFEKILFEKSFEYKMSSSAPSFNAVKAKYEQLKKSWEAKKLDDVGKHLLEMKIDLTMLNEDHWLIEPELILQREVYEIGAQYSVAMKDQSSFERYMAMLKTIYQDHNPALPESARMYELLGLNLLYLLSQNRLGDFHTELEMLPLIYCCKIHTSQAQFNWSNL